MLNINLVPEKTKKEINLKKAYKVISLLNYTLIFIAIIIGGIFIFSKTFLVENSSQDTKNELSEIKSEKYGQPREINRKLSSMAEITEKNHSYLKIIEKTAKKMPTGISLSRMRINTEENILEMTGRADLRDTLLELKKEMEEDGFYSDIDFPLRNMLKKENIDFYISARMDLKAAEGEKNNKDNERS